MSRRRSSALVCAGTAVLLASCSGSETASVGHDNGHGAHWGYEAGNGPDRWSSMDPEWTLCAEGLEQSPIDLANATEIELPVVEIHTPSDQEVEVLNQEGVVSALDNGHTIQINTKSAARMSVGDKTYALVQFHFHAPSEHTIDGEHFPMEMHFVHQAADDALAVVGVLIEEGADNPSIAPLWAQLPKAPGTETTVQIPPEFAEHIFSGDPTGVYHYSGSLTTPPCSEGVRWFIRRTPTQFSKEQIAAFTAIYDNNNRPVQALGNRTLYLDENPMETILHDAGETHERIYDVAASDDAKFFGIHMPDDVAMTVQDRAYTSPIWYTPRSKRIIKLTPHHTKEIESENQDFA